MKNETLREKFERAICTYGMLDTPSVLVGLSGGADSSVLLFLLCEYCKKRGIVLFAAHVNHGIRGKEALRDRDFCVSLCEKLGIGLTVLDTDVPAIAKKSGMGIEECAREVRYGFFADIMKKQGIPTLATAHNADDNLETVIFNMLRGAGTKGLSGIPPIRDVKGGRLVRPLIYASKSEILDFAKDHGIEYVTDSTNADTDYTRNHIRANIVPAMREIVPSPEDAAAKLSESLRADERFIERCADELILREGIEKSVPAKLLCSHDEALFYRIISRMCPVTLERTHVYGLRALAEKEVPHSRLSLPEKTLAVIEDGALCFISEKEYGQIDSAPFRYELSIGDNPIPECAVNIKITRASQSCENIYKNFIHASIPFDKIKGQLYVRSRKDGDRYSYGGMTRKLKKLLCDKGIPLSERDRLPIICDGDGILFIPGFPPREKCEKNDTDVLNIYIEKN